MSAANRSAQPRGATSSLADQPTTRGVTRREWLRVASGYGSAVVALAAFPSAGWGAKDEATAATKSPLLVRSANPLNAEPALSDLVANWITPNELFYVRSHGPAPEIDASAQTLTISGLVNKPLVLRVDELLERFAARSAIATMTCAGNRRIELNQVKPVGGVQWEAGAIGNAKWSGVSLAEVLKAVGVQSGAKHVWFEGADEIPHEGHTIHFGGSIPIEKAMSDTPEMPGTLLATRMNGEPLSRDHGFPLRTVVPGYIGARSVKWLNRIIVSNQPSANHYLADVYKLVQDDTASSRESAPPIYENVVNGAIGVPAPNSTKALGNPFTVAGYALPSGKADCTVTRVEVSADGGQTWVVATLGEDSAAYCWRLWKANVKLENEKPGELIARVTDSSGATQPEKIEWNLKGYMNNAWFRQPLKVAPRGH